MTSDHRLPGRLQATFWPALRVPTDGHLALWGSENLAAAVEELGFEDCRTARLPTVLPRSPAAYKRVVAADVEALLAPLEAAVAVLASLPAPGDLPPWRRPDESLFAWSVAAKLGLELVAAGGVVPVLRAAGHGQAVASWRLVARGEPRVAALTDALPPAAHALRRDDDTDLVWGARDLLLAFLDGVADVCARTAAAPAAPRRRRTTASRGDRVVAALGSRDPVVELGADRDPFLESAASWIAPLSGGGARGLGPRLCLQLVTPAEDAVDAWPLTYLLQAADDPSLLVPAKVVWDGAAPALGTDDSPEPPDEVLARGLAEAARLFPPMAPALAEPRPTTAILSSVDAADLLTRARELTAAGIGVLLPAELTREGARRLRPRARIGSVADPGAGIAAAGLDAEALQAFSIEAWLGDDAMTRDELAEIVALKQPLVRWRGHWVRVDPDEALALAGLADTPDRLGDLAGVGAIAAGLAGTTTIEGLGEVEVVAEGRLADLLERLGAHDGRGAPVLDGITATLRDYQERGAAWLQTMAELQLGALLADDMGLGKTLQTITLLASRTGDRPHLVVCPTSVVGNWERELARFAPDLVVRRHHGAGRAATAAELTAGGGVVVTTYGLVRRDIELLAEVAWDVVVLDEAQQVKNPSSHGARAVRQLPARQRVALTGTPVENHLSELWSVMDFCNPGLLGRFGGFRERYAVPVERWHDEEAAARLRRLVAPFVLRRTKGDPAIAVDLPAKQEVTVDCRLTREQATLYQAAVEHAFADLGEGIDRRGRILALLTALKQICNHPAHYLGEPGPLGRRSGKLDRALELLAEIVEAGDAALVFTQYRRMGELLARHLTDELRLPEVPFLHGGVTLKAREEMVARYQSGGDAPPLLLVSLKAGGTGLNLTRATHVLHYDRWWNPAVEDQATDRAHRIGQTRMVTAHRFTTTGTLEERIAALLVEKRALADAVVGTGEAWLTELSDAALHDLVALATDDVADEVAA